MVMEYNREAQEKQLILVDDAHNLFLGKVGGFEALKAFINVINLNTENLFGSLPLTLTPGPTLKGVLGNSNYFRTEVRLSPWSDSEVSQLILARHKSSGQRISYDQIMSTSGYNSSRSSIQYAEEQYFRLLWEQSNGNPRVALFLWSKSVSLDYTNAIKVGLPESPRLEKLVGLDDTSWFVLSTVISHENLTRKEIAESINIPQGEVNHAIKSAVENKLLYKEKNNRYRIGFTYQQDLIKQLKAKRILFMESIELNQVNLVLEVLRIDRIIILVASFVGLVFLAKSIQKISDRLQKTYPTRRVLFLQIATIINFTLYIGGSTLLVWVILQPPKEVMLAVGGSAAVAIGISLKDIFASVVAGVILLFDRPFQVGDRVAFGDTYGEIVGIGLRAVKLNTLDDNLVTIPNARFLTDTVSSGNGGALDMMIVVSFHVALDADIKLAKNLLQEVVATSRYTFRKKPIKIVVEVGLLQIV